ncbi:MAG TPA: hypothetical protein H9674_02905 [Firmicutes bacterium]|nr:hypothetical protein [Bacillota bacterium]
MRKRRFRPAALLLALSLLLTGTGCKKQEDPAPPNTLPQGGEAAMTYLQSLHPTALNDSGDWELGAGWTAGTDTYDRLVLSGDSAAPANAWYNGSGLGDSWFISLRLKVEQTADQEGTAEVLLGDEGHSPLFRLGISLASGGFTQVSFSAGSGANTVELLRSGWLPGGDKEFFITLQKGKGESPVTATVYGDQELSYSFSADGYEKQAARTASLGLAVNQATASAARLTLGADYVPVGTYAGMARQGVTDLLDHFWSGSPATGNILPTWNGYPSDTLPDDRGGLWERGMIIFAMDGLYTLTGDPMLKERIISEWQRIESLYTVEQLEAAGTSLHPAVDDCGWHAMLYLVCYRHSGDPDALARAVGMVKNTYEHYGDDTLGGGLWYNNDRQYKSLYETCLLLDTWQILQYQEDEELRQLMTENYEWLESNLLRDDNIYWCEVDADGPRGKERPGDIREAGSVSFLGGNMAMAVLHARMYRDTGDSQYLDRAVRTAKGITDVFKNGDCYLNDRDAWVNGTFMAAYAAEVLTLPGIPQECLDMTYATADSIMQNARTPDGYYGGCWNGPADGPDSRWSMIGSRPQQTMTSGSTVNMLLGAALLETLTGKGAA